MPADKEVFATEIQVVQYNGNYIIYVVIYLWLMQYLIYLPIRIGRVINILVTADKEFLLLFKRLQMVLNFLMLQPP